MLFSFEGVSPNPVAIARRIHLYPCRTQKLSSFTSMILGGRLPGKVDSCRNSLWPVGQEVKTRPFHGCNAGSIPARVTMTTALCGFVVLLWAISSVG